MSNLPQRKKTPEEIAKLRESMGLGGAAPTASSDSPTDAPATPQTAAEKTPQAASATTTAGESPAAIPAPVPAQATVSGGVPAMPAPAEPADVRPPHEAKPVRSLRKSERMPAPAAKATPSGRKRDSHLPAQRRSDVELSQLRRSQAFSVQSPATHLIALTAHPFLVGIGYVPVLLAAALPFVDRYLANVSLYLPAALCVIALVVAVFIFLKKKRSLHHAGFIAAIAIFTLIFGALYYFPHLRNAP